MTTLAREDQKVFDKLSEAGALYERYIQLSRIAELSEVTPETIDEGDLPPRTDLPLTLEIHTES